MRRPSVLVAAGGGFNAMFAARRLGATVTYGGTLGTGIFADVVMRRLDEEGIALATRRRVAIDQGTCAVLVDRSGERSFISHHGAERCVDAAHLDEIAVGGFDWILLTGYSLYKPVSAAAFVPWLRRLAAPPKLFFDPGPTVAGIPKPALNAAMKRADWVSANAREAQILTGRSSPAETARDLAGNRSGALVRSGVDGCWLATGGVVSHVPGFAVDAIDTNGAGDTHAGAFLAALMAGHEPMDATIFANAAAALSTTRHGPASSPGLRGTHDFLERRGIVLGTRHAVGAGKARLVTTGR